MNSKNSEEDSNNVSSENVPTLAEIRAAARRRKILEQGEQRINKILGVTSKSSSTTSTASTTALTHSTSHSDSINATFQGTGYNYVERTSQGIKVQEQDSAPQTASFILQDKPIITSNQRFSIETKQLRDDIQLKRLFLIMAAASIGLFFEPNVMVLFFAFEPLLFILSFISTVRNKRNNEDDLQLTQPNRTMKNLASVILTDLIVFLFASIVTFAFSQLYF